MIYVYKTNNIKTAQYIDKPVLRVFLGFHPLSWSALHFRDQDRQFPTFEYVLFLYALFSPHNRDAFDAPKFAAKFPYESSRGVAKRKRSRVHRLTRQGTATNARLIALVGLSHAGLWRAHLARFSLQVISVNHALSPFLVVTPDERPILRLRSASPAGVTIMMFALFGRPLVQMETGIVHFMLCFMRRTTPSCGQSVNCLIGSVMERSDVDEVIAKMSLVQRTGWAQVFPG